MIKIFGVHHPGIELRTFRSSVRRSTNSAINATTFEFITLKIVAISKCLSDNRGKF